MSHETYLRHSEFQFSLFSSATQEEVLQMMVMFHVVLTMDNRLPYNLYCVGGDVKHCSIQSNLLWIT